MTRYLFKTLEIEGPTPKAKPETYSILGSFHFADHSSDVQCSELERLSAITRVKKLLLASFGNLSDYICFGIFMAMDMYGHLDLQELLYFLQALSPWATR